MKEDSSEFDQLRLRQLAEATSTSEVLTIRDEAEAARVSAKMSGDHEVERHAEDVKFAANRKLAALFAAQGGRGRRLRHKDRGPGRVDQRWTS